LFAEQIELEEMQVFDFYSRLDDANSESDSYFPEMQLYNSGRTKYLDHLAEAKRRLTIPVIASLNGRALGQWIHEGKRLQDAGADAVELNIYDVPTDPAIDGATVEENQLRIVETLRQELAIPLAVKIGPYYTSVPNFAKRLMESGANGVVLFNRYLEPEMNLNEMQVEPHLELSRPGEMRLPLRWIAILRDHLSCSIAASSGVHSAADAIKLLLAGADVVMMTSTLLQHGPEHLEHMFRMLKDWMEEREYTSVRQMQGSMSRKNCPDPAGFERANYIRAIVSYT
jgi:dihydroorotate dehydrogenase (fumarate)